MAKRSFLLPDLGEGLEDAEVVTWLVSEGDAVALNQPIVEVDTAKALVEIPSPFEGSVLTLHASPGDVVKVGAPLVTFDVEGPETQPEEGKRTALLVGYGVEEGSKVQRRRRLSKPGASPPPSPAGGGEVIAPPQVRKLAQEMGIDLKTVAGTGPAGRITREDVLSARDAGGTPSSSEGGERIAVRGVRRLVAEKMSRSVREIPHVTTYLSVDMTEVLSMRERLKEEGASVTPLAIIAKAFVETCRNHRKLNSTWEASGEIVLKASVHLGIATDSERGLVVPVVFDAHRLSVAEMGAEISRLAEAARAGKAKPEELTGSTVTISNVGSFRAEYGTPIINYPEASILAVGVIEERPVAKQGQVSVRPMCTLSLSFDHRILDGAEAGRALWELKETLEDRSRLESF